MRDPNFAARMRAYSSAASDGGLKVGGHEDSIEHVGSLTV
jgi:hypothetical protein